MSEPTTTAAPSTPLMKQFSKLKEQSGDALLFFRMGDFYELFGDDAVKAAPILGITLTSRDKKAENPIPMAGIPYHSATNYIQKLLNAGKKVAIAEQILPEGMTVDQIKGIVDRQIVRFFSPAVQFELNDPSSSNYLATLSPVDSKNYILVILDPPTGKVRVSKSSDLKTLLAEPILSQIQHFLNFSPKTPPEFLERLQNQDRLLMEEIPHNWVSDSDVIPFLQKQYQKTILHPLITENPAAQKALALLVQYVLKSQGQDLLSHLHEPQPLHETDRLIVGPQTHAHLDSDDLFKLINKTATSMGARYLKSLLDAPFKIVAAIEAQQTAVRELADQNLEAGQIYQNLRSVYDLERILGRISTRLAHPRDTYALGLSLQSVFQFEEKISRFQSPVLKQFSATLKTANRELSALAERIVRTQKAEAPIHTRDGGIFEFGTDADLDHLLKLTTEGEKFVVDLETREREATGIGSLKVKYNRVFGYFIEISSANLKNVPSHYQRKQTMVGGERFFTEELKKFEEEILSASQKQKALEAQLFEKLIEDLLAKASALKTLSETLGQIDGLIALSFLAQKGAWCFPQIDESFEFHLAQSRHPLVDEALRGQFVANSVHLSPETARTLIITGPNMGGKSTLMRQMAQIILLGQMGAPVPAQSAYWGVFHSLFTRIGAHDAISKGQSTFMVEMAELAHILSHADPRSFIVLDEIGRGTSTYDGMSVASASLEYLHLHSNARIVFATHYHELTELEAQLPHLKNTHMKVLDQKGKLTFLYELAQGRSSKSFGIQVAELAGLPKAVIKKAWTILEKLETERAISNTGADLNQLSLFTSLVEPVNQSDLEEAPLEIAEDPLRAEFRGLNIDSLRPIEALNLLHELKQKYE